MGLVHRIANSLRTRPMLGRLALALLPDIRWTLNLNEIGPFQIRLRRHRSFWLRPTGIYEGFIVGSLQRFIRPGDVVYDVGANIGVYTRLLCSRWTGLKVIAFEPMTENRAILLHNIKLGAIERCARVLPYALGATDTEEDLQIDDVMSASASLNSVTHGQPSAGRQQYGLGPKTERVAVRQLDTLVETEPLPPPDVLKIDIEGAEGMMLRGAQGVLRKHRPRIVLECHGVEAAREVFEILTQAGYSCAGYLRTGQTRVYTLLTPDHLRSLEGHYDLHFMAASVNPDDVREPIPNDLS